MEFYPHNIQSNLVASAVSASQAASGSYIRNFAEITILKVNTASFALNITGSRGIDGTSVPVYGPKGDTGDRGDTGPRGNSIFLLSSSWNNGSCAPPPTPSPTPPPPGPTPPPSPPSCGYEGIYQCFGVDLYVCSGGNYVIACVNYIDCGGGNTLCQ